MSVPQQYAKDLKAIQASVSPVVAQANAVEIIDQSTYATADALLGRIGIARKGIKERLAKIIDPLKAALDAAKTAMGEAKSFQDEAEASLIEAEDVIRTKMKQYQRLLSERKAAEDRQREEEAAKLRQEAESKRLLELKARTQAMRDRIAAQRSELETKADIAEAHKSVIITPQAAHSTTRKVKNAVVKDPKKFLQGIINGEIPIEAVEFDGGFITKMYRLEPDEVRAWPGVEIVEDIQIVRRGK